MTPFGGALDRACRAITSVNAATAESTREAVVHLSEEPVDVIIVGPSLDDGTRDELLNELRARHANIPLIAVGGPDEAAPLDALAYGAIEALGDDETPRLCNDVAGDSRCRFGPRATRRAR